MGHQKAHIKRKCFKISLKNMYYKSLSYIIKLLLVVKYDVDVLLPVYVQMLHFVSVVFLKL
jgi:hypothetical protein